MLRYINDFTSHIIFNISSLTVSGNWTLLSSLNVSGYSTLNNTTLISSLNVSVTTTLNNNTSIFGSLNISWNSTLKILLHYYHL